MSLSTGGFSVILNNINSFTKRPIADRCCRSFVSFLQLKNI